MLSNKSRVSEPATEYWFWDLNLGNLNSEPLIISTMASVGDICRRINWINIFQLYTLCTVLSSGDIIRAAGVESLSAVNLQLRPGGKYYTITSKG